VLFRSNHGEMRMQHMKGLRIYNPSSLVATADDRG